MTADQIAQLITEIITLLGVLGVHLRIGSGKNTPPKQ